MKSNDTTVNNTRRKRAIVKVARPFLIIFFPLDPPLSNNKRMMFRPFHPPPPTPHSQPLNLSLSSRWSLVLRSFLYIRFSFGLFDSLFHDDFLGFLTVSGRAALSTARTNGKSFHHVGNAWKNYNYVTLPPFLDLL